MKTLFAPRALFALAVLVSVASPRFAEANGAQRKTPRPSPTKAAVSVPPALSASDRAEIQRLLKDAPTAADFPGASKATLLDLADIIVQPDGRAKTITRQAIKVLTLQAREAESEIQIPYNSAFETVKLLRARTIRPDGTVLTVKPTELRTASPSDYDDVKVLSFSMPAVEPGCVIDYEYVTEQRESQIPGHFWSQWYFQGGFDPVQHTRLTIMTPRAMKLRRQLQNSKVEPETRVSADGKWVTYTWEDHNVAPFGTEPLMPPSQRMRPKLTVSTLDSWQKIASWYTTLAKDREKADASITKTALSLTRNLKTPEEKARAIFYFVQSKVRYVAIELGISAYQPRPAINTLGNQYGDCKDMAILLVSMLRAVGIDAHPVLLEAGEKFPQNSELPAPSAFNHAICVAQVGETKYWLDATAQVCPFGEIPAGDRGCEAFVVRDGKGAWETIPAGTPEMALSETDARLTLASDGSAKGTITLSGNGDYAMSLRSALLYTTPDRIRQQLQSLAEQIGANPTVTDYTLPDYRNLDAPMAITIQVEYPSFAIESGDLLLFKARTDQTSGTFATPLTNNFRIHPIYQPSTRRMKTRLAITLPSGAEVLYAPKPTDVESQLGSFARKVQRDGTRLTFETIVDDRRTELPIDAYATVQSYLKTYLKAYNEFVVVKKS